MNQQIGTRPVDAIVDDAAGEPTVPELQQEENKNSFVLPVEQHGPVQVQLLPTQSGSVVTRTVDGTTPVAIIGDDLRRSSLVLCSTAGAFWFGFDSGTVLAKASAGMWPAGVPLEIKVNREVWVMADTATATVTAYAEFWTN